MEYMKLNAWGQEFNLGIEVSSYQMNDHLALKLYNFQDGYEEPFVTLTVNFENECAGNCAFVDINNFPVAEKLIADYGIGKPTGRKMNSGYCEYPEYQFDLEKIKMYQMPDIEHCDTDSLIKDQITEQQKLPNGEAEKCSKNQDVRQRLLSSDNCEKDSILQDYTNHLLVLRPKVLKEKYRTGEFQLFFATSGFGCKPNTLGSKVFGFFLSDGEETYFGRSDFLGIADEEKLPDWARQKLEDVYNKTKEHESGMTPAM